MPGTYPKNCKKVLSCKVTKIVSVTQKIIISIAIAIVIASIITLFTIILVALVIIINGKKADRLSQRRGTRRAYTVVSITWSWGI